MPEDKFFWAPTKEEFKGVRNFAEQLIHVAEVNFALTAAILGESPPEDTCHFTICSLFRRREALSTDRSPDIQMKGLIGLPQVDATEQFVKPRIGTDGLALYQETRFHSDSRRTSTA
jgi:hypothetical protein